MVQRYDVQVLCDNEAWLAKDVHLHQTVRRRKQASCPTFDHMPSAPMSMSPSNLLPSSRIAATCF